MDGTQPRLFEAANIYIKIRVNSLQDSVSLSFSLSGGKINLTLCLSLLHLTSDIQPRTLNLSLPHTRLTETGVSCVETPV